MKEKTLTDTKLIGPFSQMVTLRGIPMKGAISDDDLEIIRNGGAVIDDGKIVDIGSFDALQQAYPSAGVEHIDAPSTLIPGFVDAHTHICFAGNRARDYAMRVAGRPYLEIAKAGGGIWDSVTQTRAASTSELAAMTAERANRLLADGVTTIEVKSGYGLDPSSELKMLRAIREAARSSRAELIATCLAAHTKPQDFEGTTEQYLAMILQDLLPTVLEEKLSQRVDIFIEESAFAPDESFDYLQKAKEMGFQITVHADQFSTGGSQIAVQLDAVSADHLEASTEKEISLLAQSNTVAVALPGASLGLGMAFTPARRLLDEGACVAIASDWNPGSAPMGDLLTQAAILGAYEKLTLAETLAGLTFRAARALGLNDRGRLYRDQLADLQAYPTTDYRDIFYNQGTLKPYVIWKEGTRI